MHARMMVQQQAQTANQSNQTAQPARPASPDVAPEGRPTRDELQALARAQREAAADLRRAAQDQANQVIIRKGVPMPAIPAIPAVPAIPAIPALPGQITVQTGTPADMIPPQVVDLAYGFFFMVAAIVIGFPLSRAFSRRLERGSQTAAISPAVSDQLLRIEQAVEAMALEVERISEAQRYLTKLQVAQGEPGALPSGERR
jgi:hypothetical protein